MLGFEGLARKNNMINKRYKLYEFVVEDLGLKIIKGEYKPGDTLPNEEIL
ncbi:MAG: GntR family transcriptional regulator, partial [Deltaproteobacteria bacterium]|nr:GntR family transcriptional regulator [Deltaproteobacteria bacterium]